MTPTRRLPFNGAAGVVAGATYTLNPAASTFTSGSAFFQISSYMDQGPVFTAAGAPSGIAAWVCPGRGRPSWNTGAFGPNADYAINVWLNDNIAGNCAAQDNRRTLVGITDGTSNTVFFGHAQIRTSDYSAANTTAGYMTAITSTAALNQGGVMGGGTGASGQCGVAGTGAVSTTFARDTIGTPQGPTRGWGSPFSQGCLFAMADATVRMFPYSIGIGSLSTTTGVGTQALGAFQSPTGSEVVTLPDT